MTLDKVVGGWGVIDTATRNYGRGNYRYLLMATTRGCDSDRTRAYYRLPARARDGVIRAGTDLTHRVLLGCTDGSSPTRC